MSAGPFDATRSKEISIFKEKASDKEYVASFKLNFYAESAPRAVWTKGQFAIDLDISIVDGVPRISGIKKKDAASTKGQAECSDADQPNAGKPPSIFLRRFRSRQTWIR